MRSLAIFNPNHQLNEEEIVNMLQELDSNCNAPICYLNLLVLCSQVLPWTPTIPRIQTFLQPRIQTFLWPCHHFLPLSTSSCLFSIHVFLYPRSVCCSVRMRISMLTEEYKKPLQRSSSQSVCCVTPLYQISCGNITINLFCPKLSLCRLNLK